MFKQFLAFNLSDIILSVEYNTTLVDLLHIMAQTGFHESNKHTQKKTKYHILNFYFVLKWSKRQFSFSFEWFLINSSPFRCCRGCFGLYERTWTQHQDQPGGKQNSLRPNRNTDEWARGSMRLPGSSRAARWRSLWPSLRNFLWSTSCRRSGWRGVLLSVGWKWARQVRFKRQTGLSAPCPRQASRRSWTSGSCSSRTAGRRQVSLRVELAICQQRQASNSWRQSCRKCGAVASKIKHSNASHPSVCISRVLPPNARSLSSYCGLKGSRWSDEGAN